MHHKYILSWLMILMSFMFMLSPVYSQTDTAGTGKGGNDRKKCPVSLNFGADFVSRYIWRGTDYGNSPSIQPGMYLKAGGLKVGFWGSYGVTQYSVKINDSTIEDKGHFAEFDFYASYTWKYFTLQAYDFFIPNALTPNESNKYYDFKNVTTSHTLEISLAFAGPRQFPLQFLVSTLVYGADKGKDSTGVYGYGTKNNYSTYLEIAYPFSLPADIGLRVFVGGIPFGSGWYGPYAGIMNVGFMATKAIPITKHYSLPICASIITNPQAQSAFFVFGISL